MPLTLRSSAFESGGQIPLHYTCESDNVSPPVEWEGAPEGTQSFALIVDDPDAPNRVFAHWVVYNIPANVSRIPENVQRTAVLTTGGVHGRNTYGNPHYDGPCPPPGPAHRYYLRLFALDSMLNVQEGATREQIMDVMQDHILDRAELMGRFASSR